MNTHTCFRWGILMVVMLCCVSIRAEEKEPLNESLPKNWVYASEFSQTLPSDDRWWLCFEDKCLDTLINMAIDNNYDLRIAQKRIALAKSGVRIAQGDFYPSFDLNLGWTKERASGENDHYFDLGLNFSWQIDLFGTIRSQVDVEKSLWQASRSQYEGAMVTLCANVATAYINLRTWQAQYSVAMTHLEAQKQVLNLTEARYKSGLASMLDVSQAKTVYLSTLSTIAPLTANMEMQLNTIALLLGVYEDKLPKSIYQTKALPDTKAMIPVGIPLDLLRRRPDIKQAEYTLASYAASVGVEQEDLLPTLSINGSIGFKSRKLKDVFEDQSFTYSVSPTLSWTLFDGLKKRYKWIEAKEQYQIGVDEYNSTVMNAVKEVQNAMISYKYILQEVNELKQVSDEAYKSFTLAVDLYKRGLANFTSVLTSAQTYLQYNSSLVSSQGKALVAIIDIYQALGGGWELNVDY